MFYIFLGYLAQGYGLTESDDALVIQTPIDYSNITVTLQ